MSAKLMCCVLCVFAMLSSTIGQSVWELRNPLPQVNDLYGVTYGNNQFIAVGDSGTILTSTDGITWTKQTSTTTTCLNSVAYVNNLFIAVGENSTILTSLDGTTWTKRTYGINLHLESVTYGNKYYVVVGTDGKILTSRDCVTWTINYTGTSHDFSSVTYGNNLFIAVGQRYMEGEDFIFTSSDGIRWNEISAGINCDLESVIYANNQFIAVGIKNDNNNYGIILTSHDGITWKEKSTGTNDQLESVTFSNNQFVIVGGYYNDSTAVFTSSSNGNRWTKRSSGTMNDAKFMSVAYGNGQYIAVGKNGTILSSKVDATGSIISNLDKKATNSLHITPFSKFLFIQIPNTNFSGKDLRISLFNAAGSTVYTSNLKKTAGKFYIPIAGLSGGVYHVKITSGKCLDYSGSVAITR